MSMILGMVLKLWTFMFVCLFVFIYFIFFYRPRFFYSLVYIISLQSKFSPAPKKNTRTERKLQRSRPDLFLWPRFKQNMAPWPGSGRGCTVRSWNPRRSWVPRSSLVQWCNISYIGVLKRGLFRSSNKRELPWKMKRIWSKYWAKLGSNRWLQVGHDDI